ncbi:putative MFS transporter, AGZA family, xanthine/uracil permease [Proteiniborus sp. DW1]|uniref:guanine permease n=1 Tax=Proteiniborus sp. DW1 TaxID=1889883 RepID=UPI00092DEB20|nr:guanine permease [Proteiniborus sp. DW1]SCG82892.1 putative MFS transporter, AGZA family, xanthine/uracil permease [Proteiniborus sp. DW1]
MFFQDLLAAIAVVINGLPQGLLSLSYGFGLLPTAAGFLVGTIGMLVFGQVAPISFQAESIVMAGSLGKNRVERLNIVFFTGIMMAVIGGLGLLNPTIDFIGPAILNSMMAGVGIMLAKAGITMCKENKIAGGVAMISAILVYFLTDSDLIYTIVISVFVSTIVHILVSRYSQKTEKDETPLDLSNEKFEPMKFICNYNVIRSVLALVTLQIGGNIAYASVTGSIAGAAVDVDKITLYSGLADSASAFLGGGPVEAIISGTAAAPNPVRSGVLMMVIMAAILIAKFLPKVARYVPSQSIAGFLFVLGALVVFPSNVSTGLSDAPMVAGVTTIVTSATDPFIGMVAGLIVRFFIGL